MLHVMLPVQYLRQAEKSVAAPQKRLMLAVLQTVLDDCQGTAYARAAGTAVRGDRRAYQAAVAYVESRDRAWPFSFENICEAIGIDADSIRRALRTGIEGAPAA